MATHHTIAKFLHLPNDNLSGSKIYLCGKIVSEINADTFCLADQSTVIDCKVMCQRQLDSKYLVKDHYIKILKPGIAKNPSRILIQPTSVILPTRKIPYIDVSELEMLSESFPGDEVEKINEPISVTNVVTAQNSAPNQIIKRIQVKIVKTGTVINRKTSRGASYLRCTVRDKSGLGYLDLWDEFIRGIEYGKILEIKNIVVEKFPPQGPPYYLASTKSTNVTDVTDEKEGEYKELYLGDFGARGKIEYIHNIFVYYSCPNCFKSGGKNDKICQKCKKMVAGFELDFGFQLVLDTVVDETFPNFKGFKKILPNLPSFQSDEPSCIEDELNAVFRGKDVMLSYTEKPNKSDSPIIQDLFMDKSEDDIKKIVLSILDHPHFDY